MDLLIVLRWRLACGLCALLATPTIVQAVVFQYDLSFTASGQSIWDTGASTTLSQKTFLGAEWQDKSVGIDLIAGDESTNLPNPLRITYDAAFVTCRGLSFSSSVCINGQTAQAPVAALGSRPRVRSCGRFAVSCKIKRVADKVRRAAYDTAFAACRGLGFSSSVCRNGQKAKVPVPALGTAPPEFLALDTRTGVAVDGTVDGRVGLELGIEIDSGSVNATVSYLAAMDIPDTTLLTVGDPINFNPDSVLAGTNSLDTSFANLALSVDAIMELSGNVSGEACVIPAGCVTGGTPFDIAEVAPILSFNKAGEGGILLLGQPPSDFGFPDKADGFPFSIDVAGLAEVTLYLPRPDATGGLDPTTETLRATGQDDLVDFFVDLDNVVATSLGVPGFFGSSLDVGALGSVGFDIIDVQMGPTIDLKQDFELSPTLWVNLLFDQPVLIGGILLTEFMSAWDLLPDIAFTTDVTTVTPTFFLEADLENSTLLDFDLEFTIDLLQIFYDFGLLGDGTLGIGNVLSLGVDLFESPDLFNSLFPLQGFDLQIGQSFIIDFLSGSTLPSSAFALSVSNDLLPDSVPEPGTLILFLAGLGGLFALRRRDRHAIPVIVVAGAQYSSMA